MYHEIKFLTKWKRRIPVTEIHTFNTLSKICHAWMWKQERRMWSNKHEEKGITCSNRLCGECEWDALAAVDLRSTLSENKAPRAMFSNWTRDGLDFFMFDWSCYLLPCVPRAKIVPRGRVRRSANDEGSFFSQPSLKEAILTSGIESFRLDKYLEAIGAIFWDFSIPLLYSFPGRRIEMQ